MGGIEEPGVGRRLIPGARLVTYPGMGHDLPRALWPSMLGQIRSLARTR